MFQSQAGEVEEAVKYAIEIGYRHIDTASYYGNEKEVGDAIREKIKDGTVKRADIFVTTKASLFLLETYVHINFC